MGGRRYKDPADYSPGKLTVDELFGLLMKGNEAALMDKVKDLPPQEIERLTKQLQDIRSATKNLPSDARALPVLRSLSRSNPRTDALGRPLPQTPSRIYTEHHRRGTMSTEKASGRARLPRRPRDVASAAIADDIGSGVCSVDEHEDGSGSRSTGRRLHASSHSSRLTPSASPPEAQPPPVIQQGLRHNVAPSTGSAHAEPAQVDDADMATRMMPDDLLDDILPSTPWSRTTSRKSAASRTLADSSQVMPDDMLDDILPATPRAALEHLHEAGEEVDDTRAEADGMRGGELKAAPEDIFDDLFQVLPLAEPEVQKQRVRLATEMKRDLKEETPLDGRLDRPAGAGAAAMLTSAEGRARQEKRRRKVEREMKRQAEEQAMSREDREFQHQLAELTQRAEEKEDRRFNRIARRRFKTPSRKIRMSDLVEVVDDPSPPPLLPETAARVAVEGPVVVAGEAAGGVEGGLRDGRQGAVESAGVGSGHVGAQQAEARSAGGGHGDEGDAPAPADERLTEGMLRRKVRDNSRGKGRIRGSLSAQEMQGRGEDDEEGPAANGDTDVKGEMTGAMPFESHLFGQSGAADSALDRHEIRRLRFASEIEHVLLHGFPLSLNDCQVEEVEMSKDLRKAYVYWTLVDDDTSFSKDRSHEQRVQQYQKALERASGKLRTHVASQLRFRHTPALVFKYAIHKAEQDRIEALLHEEGQELDLSHSHADEGQRHDLTTASALQ